MWRWIKHSLCKQRLLTAAISGDLSAKIGRVGEAESSLIRPYHVYLGSHMNPSLYGRYSSIQSRHERYFGQSNERFCLSPRVTNVFVYHISCLSLYWVVWSPNTENVATFSLTKKEKYTSESEINKLRLTSQRTSLSFSLLLVGDLTKRTLCVKKLIWTASCTWDARHSQPLQGDHEKIFSICSC